MVFNMEDGIFIIFFDLKLPPKREAGFKAKEILNIPY